MRRRGRHRSPCSCGPRGMWASTIPGPRCAETAQSTGYCEGDQCRKRNATTRIHNAAVRPHADCPFHENRALSTTSDAMREMAALG
jgi:hypothetical protein